MSWIFAFMAMERKYGWGRPFQAVWNLWTRKSPWRAWGNKPTFTLAS
jgi:hypothetical protein